MHQFFLLFIVLHWDGSFTGGFFCREPGVKNCLHFSLWQKNHQKQIIEINFYFIW